TSYLLRAHFFNHNKISSSYRECYFMHFQLLGQTTLSIPPSVLALCFHQPRNQRTVLVLDRHKGLIDSCTPSVYFPLPEQQTRVAKRAQSDMSSGQANPVGYSMPLPPWYTPGVYQDSCICNYIPSTYCNVSGTKLYHLI
ncbi:unnamed protein product, partial [Rhizoctonia solani]